ncbi:MAG: pyruvate kinase [Negativicutes bacterium]|nr:pyruvate kinase [Negativicutes bacterium]
MDAKSLSADPQLLLGELLALRQAVYQEGLDMFRRWLPEIERPSFRYSALNLAFYLALRRRDIRPYQRALRPWGLSSLGRSEAGAIANLDAVIASLSCICGRQDEVGIKHPPTRNFYHGEWSLTRQTKAVFGPAPQRRAVRIMVTFSSECASNYDLVKRLLLSGMDVARINCAHDHKEVWQAMAANVRQAEQETGRTCKIFMEIAGPKPRIDKILLHGAQAKVSPGSRLFLTKGDFNLEEAVDMVVSCTIPEILRDLAIADIINIDDGQIVAEVERIRPEGAIVRILSTAKEQAVGIKPGKGLNFPGKHLTLSPITDKDKADLDVIVPLADAVGYSFVKSAADIRLLQDELTQRLGRNLQTLPLMAKIETDEAVGNLAEIIVQAAAKQPFAVMIARGDLAVEVGYKRLAELQEEILWICEAAHVPVIWATQVLENLVKHGTPSRAEITDAAMAERAECVMLNKGPFIVEAVAMLDDILTRMDAHQHKKSPQLRALSIAGKRD